MRKNEKAFLAVIFIGFLLELSLVTWGHFVLLIGIGLLANTYLFGFSALINNASYQEFTKNKERYKNTQLNQLLPPYSILAMMIGMLFKFMAWPGGDLIIMSGLALAIISSFLVLKNKNELKPYKTAILKRIIIASIVAIVFYSLPNFFWFEIINRNHPSYIDATKKVYEDPENEEYRKQLEIEIEKKKNGV
jgi:hypothetical protein